ncbi:anti-sigma factor domain-containing protein [Streptomyces sp. NPDC059534]|uniref:anti-sigma factor n=1 Tax=Streptomyces sp. NPDC059534 TaxID=3346859 RepID=UPI00369CEB52
MRPEELHDQAGAYALDALSDAERTEFEAHLAGCASCAEEVRGFRETTARLAAAESTRVPASLEAEVMREIEHVRQLPPLTPDGSAMDVAPMHDSYVPARPGRRNRALVWALAASLASAVLLGGTAIVQHQAAVTAQREASRIEQTADMVAAVWAAPDARLTATGLPQGATGTVVVSRSLDRAVFTASGLAEPPSGKVYQLWYDDQGTMRPAGLIAPDRTSTVTLLDGPVDEAAGMGITLEPSGGSPQPTSQPLALVPFSTA